MQSPFTTPGLRVEDSDNTVISSGTTAERSNKPVDGQTRVNTQLTCVEAFINGKWEYFAPSPVLGSVINTDAVLSPGDERPIDTRNGPINITLPLNPKKGDRLRLYDYIGTWDTNYVTVIGNGKKISGVAANFVLDQEFGSVEFVFIDNTVGWAMADSGAIFGHKVQAITTAGQVLESWIQYKVTMDPSNRKIKLPANPRPGHRVTLIDYNREWDRYPLEIDPNGKRIESSTSVYPVREANLHLDLFYMDDAHGWDIVKTASPIVMELNKAIVADTQVLSNKRYPVNTSGSSIAVTLTSTPLAGDRIGFYDQAGTWHINPFVLKLNGSKLDGVTTESKIYTIKNQAIEFIYDAVAGWKLVAETRNINHDATPKKASFLARTNASYVVDASGAVINVSMPTNARFGDEVVLHDVGDSWVNNEVRVNAEVDGNISFLRLTGYLDYVVLAYHPVKKGFQWIIKEAGTKGGTEELVVSATTQAKNNCRYIVTGVLPDGRIKLPPNAPDGTWVEVEADRDVEWATPLTVQAPDDAGVTGENIGGEASVRLFTSASGSRFIKDGLSWRHYSYDASSGLSDIHQSVGVSNDHHLEASRTYDVLARTKEVVLTLPNMQGSDRETLVAVYDAVGLAGNYPIHIDADGASTFNNGASRLTLKAKYGFVSLRWLARTNRWVITGGAASETNNIVYKDSDGSPLKVATEYVLNNVSGAPTATLPSDPVAGDFIRVSEGNRSGNDRSFHIGRNGKKINGKTADFVLRDFGARIDFTYVNSTYGWDAVVSQRNSKCVLKKTISASATLESGSRYPVDTTGGSFVLTLPSAPMHGDRIEVFDMKMFWNINSVRLNPGTNKINNASGEHQLVYRGRNIVMTFDASIGSWLLFGDDAIQIYDPSVKTASFYARSGISYLVKGATTQLTVTLPSAAKFGDVIELFDSEATWGVNPIAVAGLIDGEPGTTVISGREGAEVFTYVGGLVGWATAKKPFTMTVKAINATATAQVLKANIRYHVTTTNNAQVTLPSNPRRSDIVEIAPDPNGLWAYKLKVLCGAGDSIDGAGNLVTVFDNAAIYRFEYSENRWIMTKLAAPNSSNGIRYNASVHNVGRIIYPNTTFTIEPTADRTYQLPDVSSVTEPLRVILQHKTASSLGHSVTIATLGGAKFYNADTTMMLPGTFEQTEFAYEPQSNVWSIPNQTREPTLGVRAVTVNEVAPMTERYNYLGAGVAAKFRAKVWPEKTMVMFSDPEQRLAGSGSMTFLPASGQTVNGTTSYVMSERGGFWVFELRGGDWKLVRCSHYRKTIRKVAASAAPTTNIPFSENDNSMLITLDKNYVINSVKLTKDTDYFEGKVLFKQDATGYRTVTVPTNWRELEDSPGLALIPNSRTLLQFWYLGGEWVYSLKGDKGADTEFPPPPGYMEWPSTYLLSSLSNDPIKSWARLTLTFKTDGTYTIVASKHDKASIAVASGTYVRTNRTPDDYEMRIVTETASGTVVSEINGLRDWTKMGITNKTYVIETAIGPHDDGLMKAIRSLKIQTRRLAKPRWSLFEKSFSLTVESKANMPVPPPDFLSFNGKTYEAIEVTDDPDDASAGLVFNMLTNGKFEIRRNYGAVTNELLQTGSYTLPGRSASWYQARVVVVSGSGDMQSALTEWTDLGSSVRGTSVFANIPRITTGEDVSNYNFKLELRERNRPVDRFYSATFAMKATAKARPPAPPPGFNIIASKSYDWAHSAQDPEISSSQVKITFTRTGQIVVHRREQGGSDVVMATGTYVMAGRTPSQYRLKVAASGSGGSLSNPAANWIQLGSGDVTIQAAAQIGRAVTGSVLASYTLSYTFQESGRPSYTYSGSVAISAKATTTAPTPPSNYFAFSGKQAYGNVSRYDWQGGDARAYFRIDTNGNFKLYAKSQGVESVISTGTILLPERTAANTEVKITVSGVTGSLSNVATSINWTTLGANREVWLGNVHGLRWTAAGWEGSQNVTVETRTKGGRDYKSATCSLRARVSLSKPPLASGFKTWYNRTASPTHQVQDPAAASASSWIEFGTNGYWYIRSQVGNAAIQTLYSGQFTMSGRNASHYEVRATHSGSGSISNPISNFQPITATRKVLISAALGPNRTGRIDSNYTVSITLRERNDHNTAAASTITLNAAAVCTAPPIPGNYNTWAGSYANNADLPFGTGRLVRQRMVWWTNGTWSIEDYKWHNNAWRWVAIKSGTYLLTPGRPANYHSIRAELVAKQDGLRTYRGNPALNTEHVLGSTNLVFDVGQDIKSTDPAQASYVSAYTKYRITQKDRISGVGTYTGDITINGSYRKLGRDYYENPRKYCNVSAYRHDNTIEQTPTTSGDSNHYARLAIMHGTNGGYTMTSQFRNASKGGSWQGLYSLLNGNYAAKGVAGSAYQIKIKVTEITTNSSLIKFYTPGGAAVSVGWDSGWRDIAGSNTVFDMKVPNGSNPGLYRATFKVEILTREKAFPDITTYGCHFTYNPHMTLKEGITPIPTAWFTSSQFESDAGGLNGRFYASCEMVIKNTGFAKYATYTARRADMPPEVRWCPTDRNPIHYIAKTTCRSAQLNHPRPTGYEEYAESYPELGKFKMTDFSVEGNDKLITATRAQSSITDASASAEYLIEIIHKASGIKVFSGVLSQSAQVWHGFGGGDFGNAETDF